MNLPTDIIRLIVGYLPVKHRLVCREWSELIPYNINKLITLLNDTKAFKELSYGLNINALFYSLSECPVFSAMMRCYYCFKYLLWSLLRIS